MGYENEVRGYFDRVTYYLKHNRKAIVSHFVAAVGGALFGALAG